MAYRHKLIPLLYRHLSRIGAGIVPKDILDQLRTYFQKNVCRSLLLTRELLRLLKLFEEHNIPAVPLKGPVLAETVYGNASFRQFVDLDILVHRNDALTAKNLLASQGYLPLDSQTDAEAADTLGLVPEHHFSCMRDSQVFIELHWRSDPPLFSLSLESEYLWERLVPIPFAGTKVLGFPSTDLLYMLCEHGARHCWQQLSLICDVAELVRDPLCINWKQVLEQAKKTGGQRILFLGLFMAWDLLGAALPEKVLRMTQTDPMVKVIARKVYKGFLQENYAPQGPVETLLFWIKVRERLSDQIRMCILALAPGIYDRSFVTLPKSLSFLYYLIRPIRLFWQYELGPLRSYLKTLLS